MSYKLVFEKRAKKNFLSLPKREALKIKDKLELLAKNPTANNSNIKKLQGREGYRLRVGNYRVIYDIEDEIMTIYVLVVKHRQEAYKH